MGSIVLPVVFRKGKKTVKLRALFDTGAERTLISSKHAKKLGIDRAGTMIIRGAGGKVTMFVGIVDGIEVPGTGCDTGKMMVVVFDNRAFPMGGLTNMGGIIGLDYMKRVKMEIAAFAKTGVVRCKRAAELASIETSSSRLAQLGEVVRAIRASKGMMS